MLKEIPTVAQAHSSEPVPLNRQRALKSVNVQSKIRDSFCERYNLLDAENSPLISECNALLDEHFFASAIENKGLVVGNHHRALVMQVSIETGLSPFNNEIYPVITPFGQLKVMATVDGWMRIATSEPITERTYCYSDSSNKVEINGREYEVPQWIECKVVHKDRGISVAREYFEEVFQNAQHHMPSWSRPARMLRHVSFIQALRQLISVNALADSDIIADVTAAYEAKATQAQMEIYSTSDNPTPTPLTNQLTSSTKQTPRALNIDLDNVTIEGDPSVSEVAKETEAESTDEVAVETEAESTDEVAVET
ncbi:recombinase RecT, partial [Vibrio thalassae]